jgi:glycogen operon protein
MRNLLATLFFSQGVPMLVAGDESGRTQGGNNNANCHDSEISWVRWDLDDEGRALLDFARRVIGLRNRHPLFRRRTFFRGRAVKEAESKDIVWLTPHGREMSDAEWSHDHARCLGAHLSGRGLAERDERGVPVVDDDLMLLLNAHDHEIAFRLGEDDAAPWQARIDTDSESGIPAQANWPAGAAYPLRARSLVLLCRPRPS